jgi:mycothiol synthase
MEILPFSPDRSDEPALTGYHEFRTLVMQVDHPSDPVPNFEATTGWLFTPLPYFGRCQHWAARIDGRIVGLMTAGFPEGENNHLAVCDVSVLPALRRRGIGTDLLRAALPTIVQRDRRIVSFVGVEADSAGQEWAAALGFKTVHRDLLQRLDLISTDASRWGGEPPEGYRTQRWVGNAPDRLLASYAATRTAIGDQPQHDWSKQSVTWTPERIRQQERDLLDQGIELLVVAAVHEATDAVVGITEIMLYPHRPDRAIQGHTAVLPAHRGHGLGLLVKAQMMRWLRSDRPRVVEAMASNADDNTHMVGINRRLGYTVRRVMVSFESPTAALAARLGP